jgi:hypothetical protein
MSHKVHLAYNVTSANYIPPHATNCVSAWWRVCPEVILRRFYCLTVYCQAECGASASGFWEAPLLPGNRKTSRCQESPPTRWYKQWLQSASSSDEDGGEASHNDPAVRGVITHAGGGPVTNHNGG